MSGTRRITKGLAIAAAATLALTLASCSGNSSGPADVKQDDTAPLEVWIRKAPDSPPAITAKKFVDAFTEKTGIPTELTTIQDGFETKLEQAAAQKDLPDIIINDGAQGGNMAAKGLVRTIDRDAFAADDEVKPQAWDQATMTDGSVIGVPINAQSFALFIRSDWRENLGLDIPQSWDDLDEMAHAFTYDDPDGNGKDDTYGWVIPASTERGYASWYFSTFQYSAGGDVFSGEPGSYTPSNAAPETVEAAQWMQNQFCVDKTVAPGAITMDTSPAHQAFEAGIGGMYFTGPYNMARFDASMGDTYEVVQLPAGPSGESVSLAEGENVYLMAGSENQAGQDAFAEFSVSQEGQTILMNGDEEGNIVRVPVNVDMDIMDAREDERWNVFQTAYENAKYVPAVPNWTPFRQMQAEALNTIWADCGADVQQAMEELDAEMQAELESQGAGA